MGTFKIIRILQTNLLNIMLVILVFQLFIYSKSSAQQTNCQTPNHKSIVVYEPAQWELGKHGWSLDLPYEKQHYLEPVRYAETTRPDSGPIVCTVEMFINEITTLDSIGILYIMSHTIQPRQGTENPGYALEYYMDRNDRDLRVIIYIAMGYNPAYLCAGHTEPPPGLDTSYSIGLSYVGIQHYFNNLQGTLVFADGCSTAYLFGSWNGMIELGWDKRIYADNWGSFKFFYRMCGIFDRGPGNFRREAHDAANGMHYPSPDPGDAYLLCNPGSPNIVLSPILLSHDPGVSLYENYFGNIVFDTKMLLNSPSNVILPTGPQGVIFQSITWENDHTISFYIPDLGDACWLDFQVVPARAVAAGNQSQLDGNTDPRLLQPNSLKPVNGMGPNQDFFNWTSSRYIMTSSTFDWGSHRNPIGNDIPGVDFNTPSGNYRWRYTEAAPGTNVYPYYEWPSTHSYYWLDGRCAACIGTDTQPYPITATIRFTEATASAVCLGYSSTCRLRFMPYNEENELLHAMGVLVDSNYIHNSFYYPGFSLRQVLIAPDEAHIGERISYMEILGDQNHFLIDNFVVYDFLFECREHLPMNSDMVLQEITRVKPGGEPVINAVNVSEVVDSLMIVCAWSGDDNEGIKLELRDPFNKTVFMKESKETPIIVPVIENPIAGSWKVFVGSMEEEDYPFGIVGALTYKPMVDCYIGPADIWFDPSLPKIGDTVWIYSQVHCGDQYGKPVDHVLVRCYLGDPLDGIQIGRDSYALNLEPGGADTAYFKFDSEVCEGISPCEVFVVVDPENELEEYNEDNNVASKEIVY